MNSNQRRTSGLPSGRAAATSVPTWVNALNQNPSSGLESVQSNDSFKSQLPLPYHMPNDNNSFPPNTAKNASGFGGTMLNPASKAYVPASNSPLMPEGFQNQLPRDMQGGYGQNLSAGLQDPQAFQNQYGGDGATSVSLPTLPPIPPPLSSSASLLPTHPTFKHKPTDNLAGGGFTVPQKLGGAPDPYAHFNVPNALGQFSNQDSGAGFGANTNHGMPPANYGVNQNMGYGGQPQLDQNYNTMETVPQGCASQSSGMMSGSHASYQSTGYNSGSQVGDAPVVYGQGSGQGYNNLPYLAQEPVYVKQTPSGGPPQMNYNVGNTYNDRNRNARGMRNNGYGNERSNSNMGKQRTGFVERNNQHSSKYMGSQNNTRSGRSSRAEETSHMGGPVLPLENQGPLMRYQSPDALSEGIGDDNKSTGTSVGATRNNPRLRSRRGQTITSPDTLRTSDTKLWLDTVANNNTTDALRQISDRLRSPDNKFALTSPNESDPFVTPMNRNTGRNTGYGHLFAPTLTPATAIRPGGSGMVLFGSETGSVPYNRLTNNGTCLPTAETALMEENQPFVEYCRKSQPGGDGVVRIRNIPYSVSRQEILAFLGRNARLLNESVAEPIHIVMERVTSKTLDCFVEFINLDEAVNAVNRFESNRIGGRGGRLGQRHVELELSSQAQLMKELFPKAKNVNWTKNGPEIIPTDEKDPYNSGFAGFISKEELVMLVKHVEAPQRSPFSKDCPQRPYECLISTLFKYPFYMVDHITIEDRNALHRATKSLVHILMSRLNHVDEFKKESLHISTILLKRVWRAVMLCPGFTPTMKDDVACMLNLDLHLCKELGLPDMAAEWCYLWTIGPKPDTPQDVIDFYIKLIRDTTLQQKPKLSLAEKAAQGGGQDKFKLFGDLDALIEYPRPLADQTLAAVAKAEWDAIEKAIEKACERALTSA